MPPKTRSQTARSRPANPPSLPTVENQLSNLDLEDEQRVQSPSPDYDPDAERREAEGAETRTTPKVRKTTSSTIASSQRDLVRAADPNDGRCLLTNSACAVQLCHLVAQATEHKMITKLEYVWGFQHGHFNVDTRRNMFHLRADWHILFDQSKWVLIPEAKVLQRLDEIYVRDKTVTSDLKKLFSEPTYRYYVLPAPKLQEPICRFLDTKDHDTHFPPYTTLGPLASHIHPHFVIFNTGKKLRGVLLDSILQMTNSLRNAVPPSSDALSMLIAIQNLYAAWTEVKVPDDFYNDRSNRSSLPSEGGREDHLEGGPLPKRQGLRSATRSQGQRSHTSAGQYVGGQQRAVLPFQPPEDDDSTSITDDTVVEDDTSWVEYIRKWQKEGGGTLEKSNVFVDPCDEQLAAYINEPARTPPSPRAWDSWTPAWDHQKSRNPNTLDRSQFSSNDWAAFRNDVYLTRPKCRQVSL